MLTPLVTESQLSLFSRNSHKLIPVRCSCGRTRDIDVSKFFDGQKTCGRCSWKSKTYWLSQTWGDLVLDPSVELPDEWAPRSSRQFTFLCRCGKTYITDFDGVTEHASISCGKCNNLPMEELLSMTWSNLRLDPNQPLPNSLSLKSNKKLWFLCSCQRKTRSSISMWDVSSGNSCSCGMCNSFPISYWIHQTWGDLRLEPDQVFPEELSLGSWEKLDFVCSCGRTCQTEFKTVTSGNTYSCGKCSWKTKDQWLKESWGRLSLDPSQEFSRLEWAPGINDRLWFICRCKKRKRIVFGNVAEGGVLSCGCLKPGSSEFSPAYEILTYIESLVSTEEVVFNWRSPIIKGREIDVYLPGRSFGVEYHGLYWHSDVFGNGTRDFDKFVLARKAGIRLLQVYGDEWESRKEVIKSQIRGILTPTKGKRIIPTFTLEFSTSKEVRQFLDKFHYLGAASGCITVVAKYNNLIVGAWVFMKRESGTVLWHRACWDHNYRAWNPHEKALKLAIPELKKLGFTRILTFADNRFHTGELYEKLGFTFEEEIRPNYYYTDGQHTRKSKYTFRVTAGVNEVEEAKKKGWNMIFDSGKRRYSLSL